MKVCKSCCWWRSDEDGWIGRCRLSGDPQNEDHGESRVRMMVVPRREGEEGEVLTCPDFGCNQWMECA